MANNFDRTSIQNNDAQTIHSFQEAVLRNISKVDNRLIEKIVNVVEEEYKAQYGDYVVCDSSDSNINIYLPNIENKDIGKTITVGKVSSSNSVVISCVDCDINGASTYTITDISSSVLFASTTTSWTTTTNVGSTSSSGALLDTSYTNAWYSGASPTYNPTTERFSLGFHDEFPGSTLDGAWTSSTGDDGVITVASDSLIIQDGNTGTNWPYIRRPINTAQSFEWKCHVTNNYTAVIGTSMVVGVYSGTNVSSNLYCITQLQRTAAGNYMTYGSYGSIGNAASNPAVWMRLLVNTYGWTMCCSNNAENDEPTSDEWVNLTRNVHGTPFVFPSYFFVFVTNSSATANITYTLRHLYFRYL